jgi:hypothetical protein
MQEVKWHLRNLRIKTLHRPRSFLTAEFSVCAGVVGDFSLCPTEPDIKANYPTLIILILIDLAVFLSYPFYGQMTYEN